MAQSPGVVFDRVSFAGLLLFDDPTTGLDPLTARCGRALSRWNDGS
jgi:hypothetical protein